MTILHPLMTMLRKTALSIFAALLVLWPAPISAQSSGRISVESRPSIEIGSDGSDDSPLLARVLAAVRTSSGFAVADARAPGVFLYDARGKYQRRIGREGRGPGEFAAASWAGQCFGDSLVVWDSQEFRFSVFDRSGKFARQFRAPISGARAACAPSGTIALLMFPKRGSAPGPSGAAPIESVFVRLIGPAGDSVGVVGPFPFGDGRLFGAITLIAVGGNRIVVGTGNAPFVDSYDLKGGQHLRTQLDLQSRRTSQERHERAIEAILDGMKVQGPRRADQKKMLLAMPIPDRMPFYRDLAVSPSGVLWVATTSAADGDTNTVLKIFHGDGKSAGEAEFPKPMRLLNAGDDYLITAYEADDGAPRVGVFRVRSARAEQK